MDISMQRDQMVREWGLQDLTPAEQDATIDKIGAVLYQSIAIRMMEIMDKDEQAELDALTTEKGDALNAAEALAWMRDHISGFDAIAAEETAKLRERILAAPR